MYLAVYQKSHILVEDSMSAVTILIIAGVTFLAAGIGYQIYLSVRFKGLKYNWFSFKKKGQAIGLSKPEIKLLRDIGFRARVANFNNMYTSIKQLDNAVMKSVNVIRELELTDEEKHQKIESIFLLRNKMDNIFSSRKQTLSSTVKMKLNTRAILTFERIGSYESVLLENNEKHLAFSMPEEALNTEAFSWKGKKVKVGFQINNDAEYNFMSKVLDQSLGSSCGLIHINHTNRLTRVQRRLFRRNNTNISVNIFTLKITSNGGSRRISAANPTPFHATITNISAGGVAIRAGGILKENTLVKLDFSLDFETTDLAIGRVLGFSSIPMSADKMLHIKFERISKKTRNRIFEYIYKEDKQGNYKPKTIIPTTNSNNIPLQESNTP